MLSWGQERLKSLLSIWKARRAEGKVNKIEGRIVGFSARLDNLQPSEAKTIKRALERIASNEAIDDPQFEDLAGAMLTAWEHGKLRELVCEVADTEAINAERLVELLIEEQVLSALHVLEIARAKIDVLHGLKERIAKRELELAVRNFIAKHPWLISPEWETFTVEKSVDSVLEKAAKGAQLDRYPDWAKPGRVDLVLSSGKQLIVMEFMRPGLRVDYDHFSRFQRYVNEIRSAIRANTGLRFKADLVTGYLVADKLIDNPPNQELVGQLATSNMFCLEWPNLLSRAESQWRDFMSAVVTRAPDDTRVKNLARHG